MSALPPFDRGEADRIFARLLELPPEERPAALAESCDDEILRRAVRALLDGAEAAESPLDPGSETSRSLWEGLATETQRRESPVAEDTVLGPFRIREEIARGGMAVVYRAEQVDGEIEREVAVKILKLGLDTEEVIRRFEQERQILADLDHASIARLYAAGHTEDGRPYFAMERVEGVPIDRYCDEHRLSVDERLELFCAVAEAVEYAHRNLVVHRDLKPSNILVTDGGGPGRRVGHGGPTPSGGDAASSRAAPQVKLLDFGIARLLDVELGDGAAAAPTRALVRMMTPEYASPEQVRGERVATTSDVYQLGVLLYELLTGRRPYAPAEGGIAALERAICEETPTRPSAAISRGDTVRRGWGDTAPSEDAGAAVEAICRARRTTPARLRRRLRGDLDNIVLRALRKEPERRYPIADRMVQDVRRHVTGLPVSARADTWVYRGRKFLARHAIGATATALVLVGAAGGAGFYTARIQSERDQAQAAERRAQAAAAAAVQMNRFLTGMFRAADPREAAGAEVTARELLDHGVEQIDRELAAQPETRAGMMRVLGVTYMEMGDLESAERLLTRALELRQRHLGAEQPDVAEVLGDLGLLRFKQGEYTQARERLEEAARIYDAFAGPEAPELAGVLRVLAQTQVALNRQEPALATFERALAIERRSSGEDSVQTAMIMHNLAVAAREMGDLERADDLYQRALAVFQREHVPDHPRIGTALMNLASLRRDEGKFEGVEEMLRRSVHIAERAYGPDSAKAGVALNELGDFLTLAGRHDEATGVLGRAIEILRSALRPEHPHVAFPLATLGDAHLAAGRLDRANEAYVESVAVAEKGVGGQGFSPVLAHSLTRLGRVEAELGDEAAAERSWERALEVLRHAPMSIDPQLAPSLVDLGRWLVAQGSCAEAVPLLRRGARLQLPPRSPWSSAVAELEGLLAECDAAGADPGATVAAATSQQRVEGKNAVPRGARE